MKYSDVSKEGYYWYQDDGIWEIVWVEIQWYNEVGYFLVKTVGDEIEVRIEEYQGEFRGPIEYPS